jgi:hypothetical protein
MGNWAAFKSFRVTRPGNETPFLDRLKLVQTPWFGVYLHLIHRPDIDPDPHDHPWAFVSVVLAGSYQDQVWEKPDIDPDSAVRHHTRFRPRLMRRSQAHLIISTITGPVWTLAFVGPNHGDWRFWTDAGPVVWREYLSREYGMTVKEKP